MLHSPQSAKGEFLLELQAFLTCTVTKVDWINPHIVVFMDAKDTGGAMEN
jgi:hypothetical protein